MQTPYHTILENQVVEFDGSKYDYPIPHNSPNQVNSNSRIRLFQIRLPHTTQFSKPDIQWDIEFDCSKSDYPIPHSSPNRCQPWHEVSVLTQGQLCPI